MRKEFKVSLFYIGYVSLIFLTNALSPSGVCNPGLGMLLFFITPFVAIILSAVALFFYFMHRERAYLNCLLIHFAVILGFFALLHYNS